MMWRIRGGRTYPGEGGPTYGEEESENNEPATVVQHRVRKSGGGYGSGDEQFNCDERQDRAG